MDIKAAETLAKALIKKHWLLGWEFKWTNSKRAFGVCSVSSKGKFIKLSKPLVSLNPIEQVTDTILHEIAHALVGNKHGHDKVWKAKCIEIGARPVACYDVKEIVEPQMRYVAICGACNYKHQRARKPNPYQKFSCRCQHGKPWNLRLLLRYVDTKTVSISIKLPSYGRTAE